MNKKTLLAGLLAIVILVGLLERDFFIDFFRGARGYKKETLSIVLNTPYTDLSPHSVNLNDAIRSANIYEGLVAFDPHLKVIPALALSWGNVDPLTWEFKLRHEVVFHDGSPFTAASVTATLEDWRAAGGQLENYVRTIDSIEAADDFTVRLKTRAPDPLLLSKLTKLYVTRPGRVGTGPYTIAEERADNTLKLTAFADYWGRQPVYRTAEYKVMTSRTERKTDFENGEIDILAAVPRAQALELPQEQLKKSFSLEVNFLMFKMDDPLFKERPLREAMRTLFDPKKIQAIGNDFVRPASQFVAPGVFGFNPDLPAPVFDEALAAKNLFGNRIEKISLDYLDSFETLGEYLGSQMKTAGFSVRREPLTPEALLAKIQRNESRVFLIGWQAEDGDAGGFLDAFIHSQGEFNRGRYKNPEVDALIEASRQEMDRQKRLPILHQIMAKINEDLIGIPLFESSRIYAVKPGVLWEPRVDGLVLAAEVE